MFILKTIILFTLVKLCYSENVPTVVTNLGVIKGHHQISQGGNKYESYEGIPYALPPINDRRFEPPQPITSFHGELTANKFTQHCLGYQRDPSTPGKNLDGVEDCLYLNVYVPLNKTSNKLPVIFWIYGGGFQYSTLNGREQEYLIDHDIVFVSFHYRLGTLGFLSTEDEVVPGNMGLKDQALALKWVHDNIHHFNGDPNNVTITGLSAGGASVHYHYLSPMTAGLFRAGISFSGTAFDSWTQTKNSRDKFIRLGEIMNCTTSDVRRMVQCLKRCSATELVQAQTQFMPWHLNEFSPFGPVVEKHSKNPYIDRSPIDIIASGDAYDAPWITGVVSEEGIYPVGELITNDTAFTDLNENWKTIAPHLLQYGYTIPKTQLAHVAHRIRYQYWGSRPIDRKNIKALIDVVSDRVFRVDAEKAARMQAKANKSPVRFYYYSYRANTSLSNFMTYTDENFGVSHADDVLLVIGNSMINPKKTESDFAMHKQLVKFWLSVVHHRVSDFHPKWIAIDPNKRSLDYLHISGPDDFKLESDDNLFQKRFWNTIDFDENKLSKDHINFYD